MGQVYEAEDEHLKRRAAVKLIRPDLQTSAETMDRFFREARAAARLEAQGAVRIFEFGHAQDGTPFIAMEFLSGESLRARLAQGSLPPARALAIARQIAAVLQEAHERQVVHRDLKPDNIILLPDPAAPGEDLAKVVDFGIARLLGETAQTQAAVGTPAYMAPEQCQNGEISGRTDVYALGVLLYEMLCGQPPFVGAWTAILIGHMTRPPPPLPASVPEVLAALVDRMLAKDPAGRLDMADVLKSLRAADVAARADVQGAPIQPQPTPARSRPAAPARAGTEWPALLVGLTTVMLLLLGVWWLISNNAPQQQQQQQPPQIAAPDQRPSPPPPRWRITTGPAGAEARRSDTGALLCKTPCDLPAGPADVGLSLSLPDHLTTSITLRKDQTEDVHRDLVPEF